MKNNIVNILCGAFVGSAIGSFTTLFVLKKLKKLDVERNIEAENKRLDEVYDFYKKKLKEIEENAKNQEVKADNLIKAAKESKVEVIPDEKEKITNPKFLYQEELAKEDKATLNSSFVKGNKIDYSKIAKEEYGDLKKEYERDKIEIDEKAFPHLITKDSYEHAGGYVKEEMIYYEQNGIFATVDDDTIMDQYTEQYFGLDNLSLFGQPEASLDGKNSLYELYLRDEVMHIDFHIIFNGTDDFDHLGDCR